MGRSRSSALSAVVVLLVGLGSRASADFTDVASAAGIERNSTAEAGFTFADFDNDGDLDALILAGSSRLYFSSGGADPTFTDVTAEKAPGLTADGARRSGVAADLNNDGYVDFLRTQNDLFEIYLNRGPPDFTFGDGATPDFSLDDTSPDFNAEGAGVLDYDNDGWLDIVVDNDGPLRMFRNPADGTAGFILADHAETELPSTADVMLRDGDYVAITDFDVDGFVDIAGRNVDLPELFVNDGDGTFSGLPDLGLDSVNTNKGGTVFCDFDSDGLFDFFFSDGAAGPGINRVWRQTAPRVFEDTGEPALDASDVDGVACGDVDNDGDEDLFIARSGTDELYLNQLAETGSFALVRDNLGITGSRNSEGASFVDYDQDGDLDLYVAQTGPCMTDPMTMRTSCEGRPNQLWRNDAGGDYLAVRVLAQVRACADGTPVHRDDHGAVLDVVDNAGWSSGVREVNGGMGHGTQGSPIVHFGLPMGSDVAYTLTVRFSHGPWPDAPIRVTPSSLGAYQLLTVLASDPDADGIPTDVEQADFGGLPDLDGDGLDAWHDVDADGDGILDATEAGDDDPCTPPLDADGNGIPDYVEGPSTPDGGVPPALDAGPGGVPPPPDTLLEVHGSGCIGSVAGRGRFGAGAVGLLLLLALGLRRRRR